MSTNIFKISNLISRGEYILMGRGYHKQCGTMSCALFDADNGCEMFLASSFDFESPSICAHCPSLFFLHEDISLLVLELDEASSIWDRRLK